MEKAGLVKSLEVLRNNSLTVGEMVTDRHMSIAQMMRDDHPAIRHVYDVWHVAKGVHP